ncbi:LPS export ABC transporter permease LptG [Gallaecimonas pentaromativorans]|uniref:Lipopolysaccharide export system permease protein n=1 Tax=Gallaecimonas pentaromativorans TaxID=584787 RepID=A0A3N1PVY4_9GAMM|nr:LPS export ABC transporter permease LptG [Gallaecimonas pentaromativorans]MED5524716.1 LPS export ABC transporter permease LptG [Pseudomonadota bacterium]ROQ28706.1 lipopolysaccharide export system permease protein [Gallaecimonas pentaromativorans]
MKIIDLYIGRVILTTTLLCLAVLVGLSGLIKFVDQLKYVGRGLYDTADAGIFVLFSMPRDLEVFFPMGVLLGGLIGLGMMASNSELTVMQASGMSKFNIIASAMKTMFLLMIMVVLLSEFVAPGAERYARDMRTQAMSGGTLLSDSNGLWARDGNRFVHIQQLLEADEIGDVTLYEFDGLQLKRLLHADHARWIKNGWELSQVQETWIDKDSTRVDSRPTMMLKSDLTPEKLGVVTVKPEALSLRGLTQYVEYLVANKQDGSRYKLAFWRKIFAPLNLAVMLLLACSFVFGPLRTVPMGARIILGIIAGFSFFLLSEIFGPLSLVYEVPPLLGAILPGLLFIGISVYLLRRPA